MRYTIGDMAKLAGLPASTLRYYDKEGLLPSLERSDGGIRLFTETDYGALMVIECLKRSGLSIKEIRSFMDLAARGDETLSDRLALFRGRKAAVEAQMAALEETLALLSYKCWYYETAQAAGTEEAVRGLSAQEVPAEHRQAMEQLDVRWKEGEEALGKGE